MLYLDGHIHPMLEEILRTGSCGEDLILGKIISTIPSMISSMKSVGGEKVITWTLFQKMCLPFPICTLGKCLATQKLPQSEQRSAPSTLVFGVAIS